MKGQLDPEGGGNFTRRDFLRKVSLSLTAMAGLVLPLRAVLPGAGKGDRNLKYLPGEGSIFEPRRDRHWEDWARKQGSPP